MQTKAESAFVELFGLRHGPWGILKSVLDGGNQKGPLYTLEDLGYIVANAGLAETVEEGIHWITSYLSTNEIIDGDKKFVAYAGTLEKLYRLESGWVNGLGSI